MDTMWKRKCSLHNGLENYSPRPKKARRVRLNVKVTLTFFFFDIESVVHHEFLRQGETVNRWYFLECWNVYEELSGEKGLSCGETAPGSSIMTMCQLMHRYSFVTFWPTRTQLGFLGHPTHLTCGRLLSYFPNWNPLWTDDFRRFNRFRKIRRRSYARSQKRRTRTVSRSSNGIGSGASMQEGSPLKAIRFT
jgi:hypothetical protein